MSTSQPTFSPADAYARLSDIVKHDAREQENSPIQDDVINLRNLSFFSFAKVYLATKRILNWSLNKRCLFSYFIRHIEPKRKKRGKHPHPNQYYIFPGHYLTP